MILLSVFVITMLKVMSAFLLSQCTLFLHYIWRGNIQQTQRISQRLASRGDNPGCFAAFHLRVYFWLSFGP